MVRSVAAPIARALDLELVDVEWVGQGAASIIRVTIDKSGGVNLDDCEQVHLSLGHALDVADPIPHAYRLEVSSPGLDRPLKSIEDYRRAIGKLVTLKLHAQLEGQWRVSGRLLDVTDGGITVDMRRPNQTDSRHLAWESISGGRLEVEVSARRDDRANSSRMRH